MKIEVELHPGVSDPLRYITLLLDFSVPPPYRTPDSLRQGVPLYDPDSGDRRGTATLVDID